MRVFKFGGASVKDAESVRNVSRIIETYGQGHLMVVISAMGKTTNLLEEVIQAFWNRVSTTELVDQFKSYHNQIIADLMPNANQEQLVNIHSWYDRLESKLSQDPSSNFHFEYDQIVSFGELVSTTIVATYLSIKGKNCYWLEAGKVIKTNDKWREAQVNWDATQTSYQQVIEPIIEKSPNQLIITQGFIGHSPEGLTTTLGREGSDFTGAILAYVSNAESLTIWKDVPGMLNADPRFFSGTVLLKQISYREAIELAYYGASVIHPKTIQPLKNKEIPLYIKSFIRPEDKGTVIQSSTHYDADVASYIFKPNQILISVTPKDFSFITEEELKDIFSVVSKHHVRINIMQNSAVSFSFLIDDKFNVKEVLEDLEENYMVKYNKGVELLTIRHFDESTLERLTEGKNVLLEQKTRQTARLVLQ